MYSLKKLKRKGRLKKVSTQTTILGKIIKFLKNITKSSKMECPTGILDTYTTNW
jgi:hypothetical protein